MPRRPLAGGDDEPTLDRRRSDRLLHAIEHQLHERIVALAERVRRLEADDRIEVLERDGSRGLAVLAERVRAFEASVADKVAQADRTHEDIRRELARAVEDLGRSVHAFDEELARMERRVRKLEEAEGGRLGFQTGLLRLVGPYAGFVFGLAGVIYALAQS